MDLTVLGATGATGRHVVDQALARGHRVTALVRTPAALEPRPGLTVLAADVAQPRSIVDAVADGAVVVSVLGKAQGAPPDVLTAGAAALTESPAARVVSLGAFGTGRSAAAAGPLTRALLAVVMGRELADKTTADETVLAAGGTVFHAGPLTGKPLSTRRRTVALADVPHRLFPASVSRPTVAAAMLDEAETIRFPGAIAVPLTH